MKRKSAKLNRRGFTLVELIVVIAIMAVLAGTVAGVTVSTLNKQTDKVNFTFQCKAIATKISTWAYDYGEDYERFGREVMLLTDDEIIEFKAKYLIGGSTFDDFEGFGDEYATKAYDALKRGFNGLKWSATYGEPEKKGEFSADIINKIVYVYYRGKSKDYAEVGYKIDLNTQSDFPINPVKIDSF